MAEDLPTQADVAVLSPHRYRVYSSSIWAPLIALPIFTLGGFLGRFWPWVLWALLFLGAGIILDRRPGREVTLSEDGRLFIRGRRQSTEIDVRRLTEVRASALARVGWRYAQVRWPGGSMRLSTNLRYLSGPADQSGQRPGRWSGEGFRDLVYRMHLINPGMTIRGVRPPSWVPPWNWYKPPRPWTP